MALSFRVIVSYLFAVGSILTGIATWWVGGNAILAGTITGGSTLLVVGFLFISAGLIALPVTRRELNHRFDMDVSSQATVLLSGGAIALAVFLLFAAFIALLAS